LPLRIHPRTREAIDVIMEKKKPINDKLFFGAIIGERAVVSIIKEDPKIVAVPAGKILLLLRFFKRYQPDIQSYPDKLSKIDQKHSMFRLNLPPRFDRRIEATSFCAY